MGLLKICRMTVNIIFASGLSLCQNFCGRFFTGCKVLLSSPWAFPLKKIKADRPHPLDYVVLVSLIMVKKGSVFKF